MIHAMIVVKKLSATECFRMQECQENPEQAFSIQKFSSVKLSHRLEIEDCLIKSKNASGKKISREQ